MRQFYVYILSSASRVLYIGVTNDLQRRLFEHRLGTGGFSGRYLAHRLVYFEAAPTALAAIAREKQLKGWNRRRKLALICATNPNWNDLSSDWLD